MYKGYSTSFFRGGTQTTTRFFKLATTCFFYPARKKCFYNFNRLLNKHLAFEYLNTILNHCFKYSDENSAEFHRSTSGYTKGRGKEGFSYFTLAATYINYLCKGLPQINTNRHFQRQVTSVQDLKLQGVNPTTSNCRLGNSEQNGLRYKQQEREWSEKRYWR